MLARATLTALIVSAVVAAPAAAVITNTRTAADLAGAIGDGTGAAATGSSIVALPPEKNSANYTTTVDAWADTVLAGFPTRGPRYAILSNGDALNSDAASPNNSGVGSANGPNVRGNTDFDVTILKVDVMVPAGMNCLGLDFRFLTDEYPNFVGGKFNDAFIAELDTSTWTTSGSTITAPNNFAFDPGGKVISVNALGATSVNAANASGTSYGGATALLHAYSPATPGAHSIYLSIFDQGDMAYDSAVFVDNLAFSYVAGGCAGGASTGAPAPPPAPPPPVAPPAPAPNPAAPPAAPVVTKPPPLFGPNGVVTLPSAKKCVSRRKFSIRIRELPGFELATAVVFVNRKRVSTLRQNLFGQPRTTATVDLRGLPKGTFKVKIVVVSATGKTKTGTRKYRTCSGKRGAKRNRSPV